MDQLPAVPDLRAQIHSTPHIILWWSKSKTNVLLKTLIIVITVINLQTVLILYYLKTQQ